MCARACGEKGLPVAEEGAPGEAPGWLRAVSSLENLCKKNFMEFKHTEPAV